jgi:predicted ABC-class ATPase
MERLKNLLTKIDGKGYKAYKDIAGEYETKDYSLEIMNVQGDPFASPTMFEWSILTKKVFDSNDLITNKDKKLAFEDFILRYLHENFKNDKILEEIFILEPQVEILKRSVVSFKGERLFIKYYFNLPARGRNVLGDEAFEKISSHGKIIYDYLKNLPLNKARSHVNFYENIENLREQLKKDKIKVFVGEGTVFEKAGKKIPFVSPKSLLKEYKLDDGKLIRGMALKEGITLITGFDFQGKSTLLKGIMSGVYNKIEGCGREFLLTDKEAVNIMAEKGRSINGLDMSSFIKGEEKATAPCDEVIDASGCYLLPGAIDEHVHFRDPGLTHKADITTESHAAAAGGVTSIMDMPNTNPQTTTLEALEEKFTLLGEKSAVNYSCYFGATNNNYTQFAQLDKHRVCGVKLLFVAPK